MASKFLPALEIILADTQLVSISNKAINRYYEIGKRNGAIGGKLLGAGGGGFLLFYAPKKKRFQVVNSLSELFHLPIKIDNEGSRISYYDNSLNN